MPIKHKVLYHVAPDWTQSGTLERLNKDLTEDITGPGLYLHDDTTMLVVPLVEVAYRDVWKSDWPSDTVFQTCVWNVHFSQTILSRADAPTRVDTTG